MAQIKTIDGKTYGVCEDYPEVIRRMYTLECIETGLLKVTIKNDIVGFGGDVGTVNEPCCFVRQNIIMCY